MKRRWRGHAIELRAPAILALLLGLACESSTAKTLQQARQKLREGKAGLSSSAGAAALREAAQLFEKSGSAADQAEALYWLALAQKERKDYSAALTTLRHAMAVYPRTPGAAPADGFYSDLQAQLEMGALHVELGNYPAARAAFERARKEAVESGSRGDEWRSVEGLAQTHARQGEPDQARAAWAEARAIVAGESQWGLGQLSKRWGDFEAAQGNPDEARKHYRAAVAAHREALARLRDNLKSSAPQLSEHRNRHGAAEALLALTKLEWSQQNYAAAEGAQREGMALLDSMPTASEQEEAGLTESPGDTRHRALLEQIAALPAKLGFAPAPPPAAPELLRAIRVEHAGKVFVQRSLWERLWKHPELLDGAERVRVVPERKDGKLIGLRLFGVRQQTLGGALGFQNGDRLVRINGHEAAALPQSPNALAALKAASRLRVELDRRGARHELEFVVE